MDNLIIGIGNNIVGSNFLFDYINNFTSENYIFKTYNYKQSDPFFKLTNKKIGEKYNKLKYVLPYSQRPNYQDFILAVINNKTFYDNIKEHGFIHMYTFNYPQTRFVNYLQKTKYINNIIKNNQLCIDNEKVTNCYYIYNTNFESLMLYCSLSTDYIMNYFIIGAKLSIQNKTIEDIKKFINL